MKKGDIYKVKGKELFYQLVGYWGEDLVFAPVSEEENQVQIYCIDEVQDFIKSGYFSKLHQVTKK